MDWIDCFDVFLFDFDGLLVDTEPVHYRAYLETAERFNHPFPWSFQEFLSFAHISSKAIQSAFFSSKSPLWQRLDWQEFYNEKKRRYYQLLEMATVELVPGIQPTLEYLQKKQAASVIVTNSPRSHVENIQKSIPLLQSVQHTIAREDYSDPKPSPTCYELAISRFAPGANAKVVGFEDSLRGIQAVSQTKAYPVLVVDPLYPLLDEARQYAKAYTPRLDQLTKQQVEGFSTGSVHRLEKGL